MRHEYQCVTITSLDYILNHIKPILTVYESNTGKYEPTSKVLLAEVNIFSIALTKS